MSAASRLPPLSFGSLLHPPAPPIVPVALLLAPHCLALGTKPLRLRSSAPMDPLRGVVCKAHSPAASATWVGMLPSNINQLIDTLAAAFKMYPHSLRLRARHEASGLYVHLRTQLDLDLAERDLDDEGMHVLTVEVAGLRVGRKLDALSFMLSCAATVSQIVYVATIWFLPVGDMDKFLTKEGESNHVMMTGSIVVAVLLINLLIVGFFFDHELTANVSFRVWMRQWDQRVLCLLTAPLSVDLIPFLRCGIFGLHAPLSCEASNSIFRCGLFFFFAQDCAVLWQLSSYNSGALSTLVFDTSATLADESAHIMGPRWSALVACGSLTLASSLLNLPKRLIAWLISPLQPEAESEVQNKRIDAVRRESHEVLSSDSMKATAML